MTLGRGELIFGDGYVYVYRGGDGRIRRQSKSLPFEAERVGLICRREYGRMVLRSRFMGFLEQEKLNAHSFRYTHATHLIEHGADPNGVAGRLGHSKPHITQNLYIHNTTKLKVETATFFADTLQTKP